MATSLARNPTGTLPPACSSWAELKAAYRFLDMESVSFEKILSPHWARTREACAGPGVYLVIEDTTSFDYTSHEAIQGMGRIGDDRCVGFFLHSTLVLELKGEEERIVGLAAQHQWTRQEGLARGPVRAGYEKKTRRFTRQRESERWGQVLEQFPPASGEVQRVYLADREGDIYELFERCEKAGFDFVIRASQPRALLEVGANIFEQVARQTELGRYQIELRARPQQGAQQVTMAVRATRVQLRPTYRPKGSELQAREITVVEAREVNPPRNRKPLHWVLLSSLPADDFAQAVQLIQFYTRRWIIEEYHKALKTGVGVEKTQLETKERVQALLGVLSLVALRLLSTKLEAQRKEVPLGNQTIDPTMREVLSKHFGRAKGDWTTRSFLIAIAKLGGYIGRNSDGPPGWLTIWRGWQKLTAMTEGYELSK